MILKNVKLYKYARCFAKKLRKCIKKDDLAKREVSRKEKGDHRLMITFPFDGSI